MNLSDLVFEHGCCASTATVTTATETIQFTKRSSSPDVIGVEVYSTSSGQLVKPGFEIAEDSFAEYLQGL